MKKALFSTIFVLIATSLIFTTYGEVFAEMKLRDKPKKLTERDIKADVKTLILTKTDPLQLKQSNPLDAQRFVKAQSLARENNL